MRRGRTDASIVAPEEGSGLESSTLGFAGTVRDDEIAGVLSTGTTGGAVEAAGRLRDALRNAPWAEMPSGCRRYYGP